MLALRNSSDASEVRQEVGVPVGHLNNTVAESDRDEEKGVSVPFRE